MRSIFTRLGVLTFLVITACSPAAPTPAPTAPQQGAAPAPTAEQRADVQTLKIAVRGMVGNPTPAASNGDQHMYWPMYDKVTALDDTSAVKPAVATKWELQSDQRTWRFTIRNDVKWPDGSALTAEDIVYTLDMIQDKKLPQLSYLITTASNKVVDATTFDVTTKVLDVTIPAAMQFVFIWPKKAVEAMGYDAYLQKPIGSGPYEMTEFKPADVLRFKKKTTAHAFRKPIADTLEFRALPEISSIIAGLRTGEIDIATTIGFNGEQAKSLKDAGIVVDNYFPAAIYLNIPSGVYEANNSPLKNDKVRAALQYAVNRDVIVNKLFAGQSKTAFEIAVPNTPYSIPNLKPVPYDPAQAKKLLADAGYANGFKITLDYTTSFTPQDVALAIQGDLKAIGIESELRSNELAAYVDRAYGRNNLSFGEITLGRIPDVIGFGPSRTFWGCGKPAGAPPIAAQWCSPEWDKLMDAAFAEADQTKRVALLRQANQVQIDANHQIPLYLESSSDAYPTKIKGFKRQHVVFFNFDDTYKLK